jgi:molybdopterin-containing oxidoreductase family iron-sulfur binding subunit
LDSNYAEIKANGVSLKVPVVIQPGQAKGSVGLAFGYGKTNALKKRNAGWSKCLQSVSKF